MPAKETQKVDEPKSFGGNSSHGRQKRETERGEAKPRLGGATKATGSKIPVSKNRRVPFKHVQASSSSEAAGNAPSSEQVLRKGAGTAVTMTTATTNTRVKKVPDFRKLHSKWSKKIERAKKENRSAISVQEFPITPHDKVTPNKPRPRPAVSRKEENPSIISTAQSTTASSEQQFSPFKADSASLHNILHGNGEPPSLSHRATLACGELKIPRDTMSYRYSMYRRRPAVAPSATLNDPKSPGLFASVSHAQGRELLTRLAATTLNSLRTVSKVNHDDTSDNAEFSSIKKSLTFSTEDECGWKALNNISNLPDSTVYQLSRCNRRECVDYSKRERAPELVPKDQFYVLEPELCDLLKSGEGGGVAQHCIGGRGQCPSPVAHLLDSVYFVPINTNY